MRSARRNLKIPNISRRWRQMIFAEAQDIAANGMIRFALAAAENVPVWTGYTAAIWAGVADEAARFSRNPLPHTIDFSGARPWYFPFRPNKDHSDVVIDDPADEQDRGWQDGVKAFKMTTSAEGIHAFVRIPDYSLDWRQEHTYELMETSWRSLDAGRLAYNRYVKQAWKESDLVKQLFGGK